MSGCKEHLPFCVYKKRIAFTDQQLKDAIQHSENKPDCELRSSTDDPIQILGTVVYYRKLYATGRCQKPLPDCEVIGDQILEMTVIRSLHKYAHHLGNPVGPSPFSSERKVTLNVNYDLQETNGKEFKLNLLKVDPRTKNLQDLKHVVFTNASAKAAISFELNSLVNEARINGDESLQILIEGCYDDNPETSILKRVEVWSRSEGYRFSKETSVQAHKKSRQYFNPRTIGAEIDHLLDKPAIGPSDSTSRFRLSVDGHCFSNADINTTHDFDSNRNAYRYEGIDYGWDRNRKRQQDVNNEFRVQLAQMRGIMGVKLITYPNVCSVKKPIYCVVCKTEFPTLPLLIHHIITTYPKLAIVVGKKIEPDGNEHVEIQLFVNAFKRGGLGRPDVVSYMVYLEEVKQELFFSSSLFSSMSYALSSEEFIEELNFSYSQLHGKTVVCNDCRLIPHNMGKSMSDLEEVYLHMNAREVEFTENFFWVLWKNFLAKSHVCGIQDRGIFQILRIFVLCHQVPIAVRLYRFRKNFDRMIGEYFSIIFPDEKELTQIEKMDLHKRMEIGEYDPLGDDGHFIFKSVWNNKKDILKQQVPDRVKKVLSKPCPQTYQERKEVWDEIRWDEASLAVIRVGNVLTPNWTKNGNIIHVPKCLFFGIADKDDLIQLEHDEFFRQESTMTSTDELAKLCSFSMPDCKDADDVSAELEVIEMEPEELTGEDQTIDVIEQYRKLSVLEKPNKQDDFTFDSLDFKKMLETCWVMEHLSRNHEHLGFPVKKIENEFPFVTVFKVGHLRNLQKGDWFTLQVYRTDTKILVGFGKWETPEMGDTEISAQERSVDVNVVLDTMIAECKVNQAKSFDLLIEGFYSSFVTEDGTSLEVKNSSYLKRVVVWTREQGYILSSDMSILMWPVDFEEAVASASIFETLLDTPESAKTESSANYETFVMRLWPDGMKEEETRNNWENCSSIACPADSFKLFNNKVSSEVVRGFSETMEHYVKIFSTGSVTYTPKCATSGNSIECIVCSKVFKTVPALVCHLFYRYPELLVRICKETSPNSMGTCHLLISARKPTVHHLYNPQVQEEFYKLQNEKEKFGFLSLRAFSTSRLFLPLSEFEKDIQNIKRNFNTEEHMLACHDCQMEPLNWSRFRKDLLDLHKIANMPGAKFDEQIVYLALKGFFAKVRAVNFFDITGYQLLKLFLYTNKNFLALVCDNFNAIFNELIVNHSENIFPDEIQMARIHQMDLQKRVQIASYNPAGAHGTWIAEFLCHRKEQYLRKSGPGLDLLKRLLSKKLPLSEKESLVILNLIRKDEDAAEDTGVLEIFTRIEVVNKDGFRIPRCMYLGSSPDEQNEERHTMIHNFPASYGQHYPK
ncbi:unnamed protein product [Caenorhabditis sp. 36 PRJEB53466]|nr:unnamed protein product [Caenorhabditis sp. 36 PRJEB53466]